MMNNVGGKNQERIVVAGDAGAVNSDSSHSLLTTDEYLQIFYFYLLFLFFTDLMFLFFISVCKNFKLCGGKGNTRMQFKTHSRTRFCPLKSSVVENHHNVSKESMESGQVNESGRSNELMETNQDIDSDDKMDIKESEARNRY